MMVFVVETEFDLDVERRFVNRGVPQAIFHFNASMRPKNPDD